MQRIKFYLLPRYNKNADGLSLMTLNLRIDGIEKRIHLSQYIPEKNWDRKKKALVAGQGLSKLDALKMQASLEKVLEKGRKIVMTAIMNDQYLTHDIFEKSLKNGDSSFNLIKFAEDYIERNPDNWVPTTVHSYQGVVKLWKSVYGKAINQGHLPQIREKLEKAMIANGNCLNTRKKRHRQTKSFIYWAQKEYSLPQPYTDRIGSIKGNRDILEPEELRLAIKAFKNQTLPTNLHETLQQFLFSCFTGCRYSDMVELNERNLRDKELEYIAVKTRRLEKRVKAPLPAVAMPLIQNYRGRLFNMRTDQVVNRHLKRIMKVLGVKKHITFHCARHTFGTLYIVLGGDVTNLQEIMAHADIATTMEYVHMAKRLSLKELTIFDDEFGADMKVITTGNAMFMEVS